MSPIRVSCIFCDRWREQAIEDIIPDWIAKEIGGKPPFTVDYFDDVRGAEAKTQNRRFDGFGAAQAARCLRQVQQRMDVAHRKLCEGVARRSHSRPGETRDSEGLPTTSPAWCQLKCICIDARYGGGYEGIRHLPPEVAHAFGQRGSRSRVQASR